MTRTIEYSIKGAPRGTTKDLIKHVNSLPGPVVSLDIPSGLDSDKGKSYSPGVNANANLSLALPKTGFLVKESKEKIGGLFLADISVPNEIYKNNLKINVANIFENSEIIEINI